MITVLNLGLGLLACFYLLRRRYLQEHSFSTSLCLYCLLCSTCAAIIFYSTSDLTKAQTAQIIMNSAAGWAAVLNIVYGLKHAYRD